MSAPRILRRHAATLVTVTAALACAGTSPEAREAPRRRRPNIVLVVTDDLDARSVRLMPRVQALLAAPGATFANSVASDPLCAPSRASILTGQYAHNHGVRGNEPPLGGFQAFRAGGREASTVATWLRAAGYRTALLGKYLNGYPADVPLHVPPGWDEWFAVFSGKRSDFYFDYSVNENGRVTTRGRRDEDYETDVLARKAVELLKGASPSGPPLFLYIAPSAPHLSATAAPRHREAFARDAAPRGASFNEADVSDKPGWVRRQALLPRREIRHVDRLYRKRLQSLMAVDEMVRAIVMSLEERGLLEETYIFFTSDNGFLLGEHRVPQGKAAPYEESIRVPLVVRGPGVPAGRTVEPLVANIDLAPTLAEIAGTEAPGFVDGRSLLPLLRGERTWRRDVLLEFWAPPDDRVPPYAGLRTTDRLYVEYATGERELYDLRADPDELQSLHAADSSVVRPLAERLNALRACAGASCRD